MRIKDPFDKLDKDLASKIIEAHSKNFRKSTEYGKVVEDYSEYFYIHRNLLIWIFNNKEMYNIEERWGEGVTYGEALIFILKEKSR